MAQDFRASILAQLDTKNIPNEIKTKIENQTVKFSNITFDKTQLINSIQSVLDGHDFNINFNHVGFNTQELVRQAQQTGSSIGQNITNTLKSKLSKINISHDIKSMSLALATFGLNQNSIDAVVDKLEKTDVAIRRITTALNKDGGIRIAVTGTDQLNNLVRLSHEINSNGELVNFNKTLAQNFAQQESQLQKNTAAVIKYGDQLSSIITKFTGDSSNSKLFKTEHISEFNASLQSVYQTLTRLETASSEETTILKANIESQIHTVSLLAQSFHNLELAEKSGEIQLQQNAIAAIKYGDKLASITTKFSGEGSNSRLFKEEHLHSFNAMLQSVYNSIARLETASSEETAMMKANIDSQINTVSLLAQGFHNVEVAERSSDAQLKKNAVDVTGYLSKLQSVQSKYSSDSKNPIINPAHLEQINVALDKVINKIVLLENASSSETRTIKSNIDDEINSFNLLIQTLQRAENAERHDAQQLAKNTATISQYKSILEKLSYNAFNENATKPLNNAENIEKLQSAFIQAALSVEQLKNADSSTFTEMKANVDSDINGLKLLITSLQNAEYAASQLRAKPVETIKAEQIELLNGFVAQIKKAGLFTDEFKAETDALRTQLNGVFDADTLKQYLNNLSVAQARYKGLKQEASQFASAAEVSILKNKMETWLNKNSKASKQYGDSVRQLIAELNGLSSQGKVLNTDLKRISNSWKEIDAAASAAGLKGRTFFQQIIGAAKSLTRYFGVSTFVYRTFGTIKNGIKDIVDLDTALVDLKKTTDGTEAQLNSFYESANDIAKQLGVTTKEVISSTAEWSRLGYSLKDAETMAQVSAKFEAISPGVDMEQAQNGLVSAMKANK